jgi:hypothetical protein
MKNERAESHDCGLRAAPSGGLCIAERVNGNTNSVFTPDGGHQAAADAAQRGAARRRREAGRRRRATLSEDGGGAQQPILLTTQGANGRRAGASRPR